MDKNVVADGLQKGKFIHAFASTAVVRILLFTIGALLTMAVSASVMGGAELLRDNATSAAASREVAFGLRHGIALAVGVAMLIAGCLHPRFYRTSSFVFQNNRGNEVVKRDLFPIVTALGNSAYGCTLSSGLSKKGFAEYCLELRSRKSGISTNEKVLADLRAGGFVNAKAE